MRTYATADDLAPAWLDAAPANADRLIRAASLLVTGATRLARYPRDTDGYATEDRHIEAFRDATCQQVAVWASSGIDPDKGTTGQAPHLTSQSAGSGSVSYSGVQTTQELGAAATTLADASLLILAEAGLLTAHIVRRA